MFSKWISNKREEHSEHPIEIWAPISGESVPLVQVPDETFAGGHMGQGIAIIPSEGILKAPFDGKIAHIVKSNHAIILEHSTGIQLLLHIGIDTVRLKGYGFVSHISSGEEVRTGQTLIEFDLDVIRAAGCDTISPVIVTTTEEFRPQVSCQYGSVRSGQDLILNVASN